MTNLLLSGLNKHIVHIFPCYKNDALCMDDELFIKNAVYMGVLPALNRPCFAIFKTKAINMSSAVLTLLRAAIKTLHYLT